MTAGDNAMLEESEHEKGDTMAASKPAVYTIPVPGHYADVVAYLDLETRKVPCMWEFPNGVPLSRRWSAFIAGVATAGVITIVEAAGDEREFLRGVREAIGAADTVIYRATNTFDEGILKGRYTYARRGWSEVPFYPAMPDAETLTWDRRRHEPDGYWQALRERELDSRYVSSTYERDAALVLVHNLRDIAELIGAHGEPDDECKVWCAKVLTDIDYAYSQVFGPDWDGAEGSAS